MQSPIGSSDLSQSHIIDVSYLSTGSVCERKRLLWPVGNKATG